MWLDADTIVTNPEIRLESLLPRSTSGPDFVITVDGGGYNAGIWLLRSTAWSYDFLDRWWNMRHHITVRLHRLHALDVQAHVSGWRMICNHAEQYTCSMLGRVQGCRWFASRTNTAC